MPPTLRDYLKRDGWLPLTGFHGRQAIADRLKVIPVNGGPLIKSVEALKKLIEDDTDLYMGFTQMFTEAGRASVVGGVTVSLYIMNVDVLLGPKLQTYDRIDQ
jgi:hypothetical protein